MPDLQTQLAKFLNDLYATTLGVTSSITALTLASGSVFSWSGRSFLRSSTNGLLEINNNAGSVGVEINTGTAPSFNNGTLATGSNNACGKITMTGGNTGGTLTFGANYTNAVFVVVTGTAATDVPQVTAVANSSFTVAGITANGACYYIVMGYK